MKHAFLALALAAIAPDAFAQDGTPDASSETSALLGDEAAIRAVIEDYFWGRQNGDADRLAEAFDTENGRFAYVRRSDEGDTVHSMTLGEFASRATNPIPYANTGRILSIDVVRDEMAMVKLELASETRTFIDYFLLYRVNGEWTILFKTATAELHAPD